MTNQEGFSFFSSLFFSKVFAGPKAASQSTITIRNFGPPARVISFTFIYFFKVLCYNEPKRESDIIIHEKIAKDSKEQNITEKATRNELTEPLVPAFL
jgi:hypothetical protein